MPRRLLSSDQTAGPRMVLPDPMLLSEGGVSPLDKPGWIYEVKYDGYRIVAGIVDGVVQLRSRGGADYTRAFPEVVDSLAQLPGGPHILDGEAVVLDENAAATSTASRTARGAAAGEKAMTQSSSQHSTCLLATGARL